MGTWWQFATACLRIMCARHVRTFSDPTMLHIPSPQPPDEKRLHFVKEAFGMINLWPGRVPRRNAEHRSDTWRQNLSVVNCHCTWPLTDHHSLSNLPAHGSSRQAQESAATRPPAMGRDTLRAMRGQLWVGCVLPSAVHHIVVIVGTDMNKSWKRLGLVWHMMNWREHASFSKEATWRT